MRVQVLPVLDCRDWRRIEFPYAAHVFLIERYVTDHTSGRRRARSVFGVTSLDGPAAHPRR